MSLRLNLMTWVMRYISRPILARTRDEHQARRDFQRGARFLRSPPHVQHQVEPGPVPLHWISVRPERSDFVLLYFHGGAYLAGSPDTHRGLMARIAKLSGLRVVAPKYRLAPEHPAPAAFEDAMKAHAQLLAKGHAPGHILLGGDSAGGGIALAVMAELCGRGQPPAGLIAFSPWADMTYSGESIQRNADLESVLPPSRLQDVAERVLAGFDPRDPRVSPLFADFPNPPPVFLQVGREEVLLDDSRRMAALLRVAGGEVTLQEWPGCPHVWQLFDGYIPEARAALVEVAGFLRRVSSLPPRSGDS